MLYDRIREIAKSKKMRTRYIEREAGIKDNTMCRWNIHTPSVDKVYAVAKVLGVTIDELMKEEA